MIRWWQKYNSDLEWWNQFNRSAAEQVSINDEPVTDHAELVNFDDADDIDIDDEVEQKTLALT